MTTTDDDVLHLQTRFFITVAFQVVAFKKILFFFYFTKKLDLPAEKMITHSKVAWILQYLLTK